MDHEAIVFFVVFRFLGVFLFLGVLRFLGVFLHFLGVLLFLGVFLLFLGAFLLFLGAFLLFLGVFLLFLGVFRLRNLPCFVGFVVLHQLDDEFVGLFSTCGCNDLVTIYIVVLGERRDGVLESKWTFGCELLDEFAHGTLKCRSFAQPYSPLEGW